MLCCNTRKTLGINHTPILHTYSLHSVALSLPPSSPSHTLARTQMHKYIQSKMTCRPWAARRRIIWSSSRGRETNLTGADGESDSMGRGGGGIGVRGGEVTAWNKATEEINGFIGRQAQAVYHPYILVLYMSGEQFNKSLHITQLITVNWSERAHRFKHLISVRQSRNWETLLIYCRLYHHVVTGWWSIRHFML